MVNFGPLSSEICWRVWGIRAKFQRVSRLGFVTAVYHVAQRRSTKLCTMSGRLLHWYTTYAFWGALAPNGISPSAKFTLRPTLAFSLYWQRYCTALDHWCQPSLRRCTSNGIMELSQRVPPIFGRAAITLGIGPFSSLILFLFLLFPSLGDEIKLLIWQQAAPPPHVNGSITVFTRLRQCARPPNTCFVGSTRVQISNGISIGSAVFA